MVTNNQKRGSIMSKVNVIGIDLAKNVFHLYGASPQGKCLFKKKSNRKNLLMVLSESDPCRVYLESCGSAHYWARKIASIGHQVKLIAPQFVKPFLKSNKNDYLDAEAISGAGSRANMRFVPIKQAWHQDIQMFHRIRERLIKNRTALCNEMRGFLLEYGLDINKGRTQIYKELPVILENRAEMLTPIACAEITELYDQLKTLDRKIEDYDKKIELQANSNDDCKRLRNLRGVGPIVATAIVAAAPDPKMFKNGREFAAWLGVVPIQHSSGGKDNLLGISKRGDPYIRKQLIHGCRSTVYRSSEKGDAIQRWMNDLIHRRGSNKTTVALAKKNARLMWAILTKKDEFKFVA